MKTITLILLFLAFTSVAFTQISKGQFLAGGKISFESIRDENSINGNNESTNYFISPNIGYFIIDKMAGGLRIDFDSYNHKSGNVETHLNSRSISPFLRYYFLPIAKKVNAFIDISYIHEKTKWSSLSNDGYYEKTNGYSISAGPSIFLTDKIALEFTAGFKQTLSDNFGNSKSKTFNSGLGLQIHLGKVRNRSKI
jgi:Outer membrane protein beta-barrel domain